MRLRTRLTVGFALVAAVPLLALTFPARRALQSAFEETIAARLDGAAKATQLELDAAAAEADRAAQDLASSEPVEALAQAAHEGELDLGGASRLAEGLMRSRGINVLALLDRSGRVLSSGHLPGRAGDVDARALVLTQASAGAHLATVEVRSDDGISSALALVAARPVDQGTARIWVLAGRQLDRPFAQHLAALTGAEVEISAAGTAPASSSPTLATPRFRERLLPLRGDTVGAPSGSVRLRLSAEGLDAAESQLFSSVTTLAVMALLLAALLGWALALRVTRPVDALAEGAQALARGELGHRVQATASGEIAALVESFNAMAAGLQTATERAAVAERIAAWQEVARRLAHEIKNPLTPIRMSVETLQKAHAQKRHDFEEIFAESSRAVIEEVDRLKRIIDEFSRFARLPRPVLEPVDLAELVGQVLALYAGSRTTITRELAPVPPVRADRDQLTQVLVNLLTNAEQAMDGAGRVRVRLFAPGAEVVLEVADAGPGIPEADRARIFEPYVTTKASGSGLGLAIAQRIVTEHGGRIEVSGSDLGGACFRVILPA